MQNEVGWLKTRMSDGKRTGGMNISNGYAVLLMHTDENTSLA